MNVSVNHRFTEHIITSLQYTEIKLPSSSDPVSVFKQWFGYFVKSPGWMDGVEFNAPLDTV